MSKIDKQWNEVKKQCGIDVRPIFVEMYGQYFANGINIGREVRNKLEQRQQPWPTLLQLEGMDSGLTHGYLTSMGVCVVSDEDLFTDLSVIVSEKYGYSVSFEKIDTVEEIKRRYPETEYSTYPEIQQWTLPGILIHYVINGTETTS
jgi:hypothetical protein